MSGSASNADLSYLRHGDTEGGIGLLALMDILRFWGKAQPLDSDTGPHWHPLVFHSLDVSAVGEVLLETQEGLRRHFARLFAMPEDVTTAILSRLLALHDIGKFARRFQAKVPGHAAQGCVFMCNNGFQKHLVFCVISQFFQVAGANVVGYFVIFHIHKLLPKQEQIILLHGFIVISNTGCQTVKLLLVKFIIWVGNQIKK